MQTGFIRSIHAFSMKTVACEIGGEDFNDLARGVHSLESVAYYNAFQDGLETGDARSTRMSRCQPQFGQVMAWSPWRGGCF